MGCFQSKSKPSNDYSNIEQYTQQKSKRMRHANKRALNTPLPPSYQSHQSNQSHINKTYNSINSDTEDSEEEIY